MTGSSRDDPILFMNKAAVFIDGGYIAKVLENEFDYARIDYGKLVDGLIKQSGQMSLLRSYYYDCPHGKIKTLQMDRKRDMLQN